MTKVQIDTPGVTVLIEADESLEDVSAKAVELFVGAGGWPQVQPGPAGFATTERAPDRQWDVAGSYSTIPTGQQLAPGAQRPERHYRPGATPPISGGGK